MSNQTQLFLTVIDAVIAAVIIYWFFGLFNSRRGIAYLTALVVTIAVLTITAYIRLPTLHFLAQATLLGLIIGLPLYFHETWTSLFTRRTVVNQALPARQVFLSRTTLTMLAIVTAGVLTGFKLGLGTKTGELPQPIPLTAANLPEGVSANFGTLNSVRVLVSAPRDRWSSLSAQSFSAIVDLGKQGEGTYDLPVTVTSKIPEVRVVRIKPNRVTVAVEPVIMKTLPVIVKFSGRAGMDLVPDEPILEPEKVEVTGPKSVVTDLTQAVLSVKLNGETKAIQQKYSPIALNPSGEQIGQIQFSPSEVMATIPLIKAGKLKTVGIKAVLNGQPAAGFWVRSLTLNPSVISLTGSLEALEKVSEVATQPISVANLSISTELSTTLDLPAGVTATEPITRVSVRIEIAATETTKTVNPEIVYDGLHSALKVTSLSPTVVSAVVAGPSALLANLGGAAIKLNLNLSAYKSAGTYSVIITSTAFTLPSGVSLIGFLPSAIDVSLEAR